MQLTCVLSAAETPRVGWPIQPAFCPSGADAATGCCYKDCDEDEIGYSPSWNEEQDGWIGFNPGEWATEGVPDEPRPPTCADSAVDFASCAVHVTCDFGGAVCDYADSDVGHIVDKAVFVALGCLGACEEVPVALATTPVGEGVLTAAELFDNIKETLTTIFGCQHGESITCEVIEPHVPSPAPSSSSGSGTCPALIGATGSVVIGMAQASGL